MISIFFVIILLCYILWAFFLAREKYHLLLVPSIIDSNFFGFYTISLGDKGDLVFLLIIMLWVVFLSYKTKMFWTKIILPHGYIIAIFLMFMLYVMVESIIKYDELLPTILVARRLFRYIAVFLYISMMFRIEKEGLNKLGELIEKITVGLSVLYIMHSGLGINVFQATNYGEYYVQGTSIFRNFAALPYFIMFSIAHISLKEKFTAYNGFAIFSFMVAIFLSYTRSFVLFAVFVLIVSLFIRTVKYSKSFSKMLKFVVSLPLALIIVGVVFSKIFPSQTSYFLSRIENISGAQSALEDQNVNLRANIIQSRIDKVLEVNPISGLGFIHEESKNINYPDLFIRKNDRRGQVVVGDQSWGNIIALVGFLGTAIFILMLLFPMFYLLSNHVFIKQEITLIAASLNLLGIVLINSFVAPIFRDGVFLISFLLAFIIAQTNYFVLENNSNLSDIV